MPPKKKKPQPESDSAVAVLEPPESTDPDPVEEHGEVLAEERDSSVEAPVEDPVGVDQQAVSLAERIYVQWVGMPGSNSKTPSHLAECAFDLAIEFKKVARQKTK